MAALNNNDNNDNIKWGDVFDGYPICVPYYYIELWGDEVGGRGDGGKNEMIREFGYSYTVNDTNEENDMIEKLNEIVNDIKSEEGYYGWITEEEEEGNYTNFQVRVMLYGLKDREPKCMWEKTVSDIITPPPPPKSAGKKK